MSKTRIIALLGIVILLGAVLTNPSEEKIKEKLAHQAKVVLKKQLDFEDRDALDLGMSLFGDQVVNEFLSSYTYTENYYLCSLTRMTWNDQQVVIATGIFNQVWINPNLDEKAGHLLDALKGR